ncbi:MAG: CopG family transcriptional regulator [Candidatus Komeilibacteria bacterium]|nr:CopG family transcriptional regulator [Candidatus Komeilibacteria bacterium]
MANLTRKYTTVSIPIPLNDKIKNFIEPTGFTSVSSFVTYILRQILSDMPKVEPGMLDGVFARENEEKVKARLRSLGYLK